MSLQFFKQISAGNFIFKEGDSADCAYIIESGKVQITIKKGSEDITIAVLEPGELFGEMAVLDGLPRSATAYAIEDCHLSIISRDILNQRVQSSDPIIRLLISILLKRIRNTNRTFKGLSNVIQHEQAKKLVSNEEAHGRIKLERDLILGLVNNEFFLEYQPVFDLKTKELRGFEALLRWQNKERGRVMPNDFIDVAEASSLILPLGEWILNRSMEDLMKIQTLLENKALFMSVNVSVHQLTDHTFENKVLNAMQTYSVAPGDIKLEVTERVFQGGAEVLEMINRIKAHGFSFTMDDFGTGYSSLNSLFDLQFETIKVDRIFVRRLLKDQKSKAIVQAVVTLASELGMNIVAEGIELESEAKILKKMGCHMGQGFLYAKSMPLDKVLEIYSKPKKIAA